MDLFLLGILIAVCASSSAYFFLDLLAGQGTAETRKIQDRLESLIHERHTSPSLLRRDNYSSIETLNRLFQGKKFAQQLHQLLGMSGWTMPVSVFILLDLFWGFLVFFFIFLNGRNTLVSTIVSCIALFLPYAVLHFNRRRYVEKFTRHFPDALNMMRNAIKAGQGVQAAMQLVAAEGPAPVCSEFAKAVHEIELGSNLNESLNGIYKRVRTLDLRIFVLGVFIQQEVGGNLVELFEHVEKTIRDRISLSREVSALSAQGKLTGLVLTFLPIGLGVFLKVISPNFFNPLLEDEIGRKILWAAVGLQTTGSVLVYRMTRFSLLS